MKNDAIEVLASSNNMDEAKINVITGKFGIYLKRAFIITNGSGTASAALINLLSFLQFRNKNNCITVILCVVVTLSYALFRRIAGFIASVF